MCPPQNRMTKNLNWKPINPPRNLRPDELAIVNKLLSAAFPGQGDLVQQIKSTKVISECQCGCPSIGLKVLDQGAKPAEVHKSVPVEAQVPPMAEFKLSTHVLLHVDSKGFLDELEFYRDDGENRLIKIPDPESLELIVLPE